ncbi:MAG: hypothetical protein IPL71_09170 [Anaerolineales bacterium]|uniref:hypothetical protein n=1 Tax=Candidatus Villigracilis proximus TaxID=3140683 RepID=UPI00313513CC|nr:hypothetical protein [Anaerolineales bacterium]
MTVAKSKKLNANLAKKRTLAPHASAGVMRIFFKIRVPSIPQKLRRVKRPWKSYESGGMALQNQKKTLRIKIHPDQKLSG